MDNPPCSVFILFKNLGRTAEWHLNLNAASVGQALQVSLSGAPRQDFAQSAQI
ncbi:MAG: hypothetical protein ACXVIO_10050 [Candidatus Angelobacter sp.]